MSFFTNFIKFVFLWYSLFMHNCQFCNSQLENHLEVCRGGCFMSKLFYMYVWVFTPHAFCIIVNSHISNSSQKGAKIGKAQWNVKWHLKVLEFKDWRTYWVEIWKSIVSFWFSPKQCLDHKGLLGSLENRYKTCKFSILVFN
jgi:hypothetical protein